MNATDDTPRRETTWGALKVGDVEISQPPVNRTRTVVDVSPAPGSVFVTFDDGSGAIGNPSDFAVTVVDR